MVLATVQKPVLGNAFQMFASAAGPMPLEGDAEARASSSEDYEIVQLNYAKEGVTAEPGNPTAGLSVTGGGEVDDSEPAERGPSTPTQNLMAEIQHLKQLISKHRAENITTEIKCNQFERDNEDLQIELSRVKMQLAKAKTESGKRKTRYEELLDDVQLGSDKLSKKLVQYKRRGDELEAQLKTDLEAQKVFWAEVNQQLHKENELSMQEIQDLKDKLEDEKAGRAQQKIDAKNAIGDLEDQLEDALQEKAEMQIQFERIKVENAKLRQEKTQISTSYEERISKMGNARSPVNDPEDEFSTEDMLRMMQETLGVEDYEGDE